MQYKPKITDNGVVLVEKRKMPLPQMEDFYFQDGNGTYFDDKQYDEAIAEYNSQQHLPTLPEHKDIWLSKEVWEQRDMRFYNEHAVPLLPVIPAPLVDEDKVWEEVIDASINWYNLCEGPPSSLITQLRNNYSIKRK